MVISDKITTIQTLEILKKGSTMNQLCVIHHDFLDKLYTTGACVRWLESGHNCGKHSVVIGTIYGI